MIALSKEFNGSLSDSDLNKVTEERDRGITISTQKTTIKTDSRDYNLTYTYGMSDTIKSLITTDSAKDGAIIVVSAADGPMAQTKEELKSIDLQGFPYWTFSFSWIKVYYFMLISTPYSTPLEKSIIFALPEETKRI